MGEITDGYLTAQESKDAFDWRYYMTKYPIMRDNGSSTYFTERFDGAEEAAMGYSLCVLRAGRTMLKSRYRDPYLLALWHELSRDERIEGRVSRTASRSSSAPGRVNAASQARHT